MFKFLEVKENQISISRLLLLIITAYIFSLSVRYIWVAEFGSFENFKWNNQIMINTNDGYFWAEGARDILRGESFYKDSPIYSAISNLTAFLAKILPFSFETIILYMPSFLGSLLAIPILLMGYLVRQSYAGFIGALIGSIAWSYYNRTMVGYYDTDMLAIVFPTFILWSMLFALQQRKNRWLIISTILISMSMYWYGSSYSLNFGFIAILGIYTLIFARKEVFNYKLITFMLIALLPLSWIIQILLAIVIFAIFHFEENRDERLKQIYSILETKKIDKFKLALIVLIVVSLLVLMFGGFAPIIGQLKAYVFKDAVADDLSPFRYFNVVQTVREAGDIPFSTFADRISGGTIPFILSTIGYILLCLRYKIFLLALPMIGLGFLALKGGLRFTVYAVPINALGMGYFIMFVSKYVADIFNPAIQERVKIGFIALATGLSIYPNIAHVIDYKVPVVFDKAEVQVLDDLKKIASRKDYVLTWWDYGYPIRYYSDINTLVDGGKHSGSDNYPVSFALSYPNIVSSANMARLNVEYTEKGYNSIEKIVSDYNFKSPNHFIDAIVSKEFKLPEKTRDIYYFLPLRMLDIFPTVKLFSNLDLLSGNTYPAPNFFQVNAVNEDGNAIYLSNGIKILKPNSKINYNGQEAVLNELTLQLGNQFIPIKNFIITAYDKDMKLIKNAQTVNQNGQLSVVYMQSYQRFLIMDDSMLNSAYIKLFVLEDYDRDLFEEVIMTPIVKVFKLKR